MKEKNIMKIIKVDEKQYIDIWNKAYDEFKFTPSIDLNVIPLEFKIPYKCYLLNKVWYETQEKVVNEIFKTISLSDIYVLNWQHDCFEYNPNENIKLYYNLPNDERDFYFPSYYPNGDYYFFISKDFSYGMLGHPWRKEIYIFGEELIQEFETKKFALNIYEI